MKNNTYEEQIVPQLPNIKVTHANLVVNKMELPKWAETLACPYCKEIMPVMSIRSISMKLNPRNIGDLCVEFLCEKCQMGNTLYFVKSIDNVKDFAAYLDGSKQPSTTPITEEEMCKLCYHNVVDALSKKET